MNETLIVFKDSENKEKLYDGSRNINYHGVTLVASPSATADNGFALYEPAYGIRIMDEPGKGFFRFNDNAEKKDTEKAVANFLDKESSKLESCQEEGNYLGQVAFDIIANNREVKNKEHNKPFQEKVENLRKNVMEKLKKGVAITVAFAACACFAPKLAAQEGSMSVKTVSIGQYENPVEYYVNHKASNVVTLDDFAHMLNEDAKSLIKESYPKMKESNKNYKPLLEETIKELCNPMGNYLFKKFGNSRLSVEDNTNDYSAFFYSETGTLLSAQASEYRAQVAHGEISPKLEINTDVSKKKNIDSGRGR